MRNTLRAPISNCVSCGVRREPGATSWIVSEPCFRPGSTGAPGFGQLQSSGYVVDGEIVQFTVLKPWFCPANAVRGSGGPVVEDAIGVAKFVLYTGSEYTEAFSSNPHLMGTLVCSLYSLRNGTPEIFPSPCCRLPLQSQKRSEFGSFNALPVELVLMSQAVSVCFSMVHPPTTKAPCGSRAITEVSNPVYVSCRKLRGALVWYRTGVNPKYAGCRL